MSGFSVEGCQLAFSGNEQARSKTQTKALGRVAARYPGIFFYQERQGAVLLRRQNMDWLDLRVPEAELLHPLPPRGFRVEEIAPRAPAEVQTELAF